MYGFTTIYRTKIGKYSESYYLRARETTRTCYFFTLKMANITISQIIDSLLFGDQMLSTLRDVRVVSDSMGRPKFTTGRHSILFNAKINGTRYGLKCYTSPQPMLQELCDIASYIPSQILIHPTPLPKELWVGDRWLDIALYPWLEGHTLAWEIRKAMHNQQASSFEALLDGFISLADTILSSEWRHGDLKPDNIIVNSDRSMTLVDIDALYHPTLLSRGERGTPPFIHPARKDAYDSHIDDYGIALITTSLAALAREPRMVTTEPMVALPSEGHCALLWELFEDDEALRALLRTLGANTYTINDLKHLLKCIKHK